MGAHSLWFMDEPEALVKAGSQFVVATHSPVLLALPDASIYEFGENGVERRRWDELDVVQQVRSFLESPDRYFRHLFS